MRKSTVAQRAATNNAFPETKNAPFLLSLPAHILGRRLTYWHLLLPAAPPERKRENRANLDDGAGRPALVS
jgi:hypothetical protein